MSALPVSSLTCYMHAHRAWLPHLLCRTPIGLARSSLVTQSGAAASSSPATATGSLAGLHQPLLPARSSTLDSAGMQAAAEEAGRGLQLQDGASQASPHKSLKGAAAWRATLPGTVLCTLALFVQKMVSPFCLAAGALCILSRVGPLAHTMEWWPVMCTGMPPRLPCALRRSCACSGTHSITAIAALIHSLALLAIASRVCPWLPAGAPVPSYPLF